MTEPTRPDPTMEQLANLALPVLIDRAGGEVTIDVAELDELLVRYAGGVVVSSEMTSPGVWRYKLMAKARPWPGGSVEPAR